MKRIGDVIRVGAGICLIVVCLLTAWSSAKQVYYGLVYPSFYLNLVVALTTLVTWPLLAIAAIGLLRRKQWAYWVAYVAAFLNLIPGYLLIPFAGYVVNRLFSPQAALIILVYGLNAVFVTLLVFAQVATRPSTARNPGITAF